MAFGGLTNPEIGIRLLVSPRTVEYHLGNVFAKLGITSRHELDRVLTGRPLTRRGDVVAGPTPGFYRGLPGGDRKPGRAR